jgi:hypothetical protein
MTDAQKATPTWRALIADVAQDATALAGAGMVVFGIAQIYPPAGWIVAGGFVLVGSWLHARKA